MKMFSNVTVTFKKPDDNTVYLGRNGTGKCKGVSVFRAAGRVTLTPINSKGLCTSGCCIDIPTEDIPALYAALKEALKT